MAAESVHGFPEDVDEGDANDVVTSFYQLTVSQEESVSNYGDEFGNIDGQNSTMPSAMPAEAMFYALPYMSLHDILTMEQVCKAFRDWICSDALLWKTLDVELPLSGRLTDEALVRLCARTKGQLQYLNLVGCTMVTESAVEYVVLSSPKLSKLFLPGCSKITGEGVLQIVKKHGGLKQLKLRGIAGLTTEHLETLLAMMGISSAVLSALQRPRYYHNCDQVPPWQEERAIDIEICSKCNEVRVVYGCTREMCLQREGCQACIFCIPRCAGCGICLMTDEREDTFCLHDLCLNCWLKLPKCVECNRPGCGRHPNQVVNRSKITFVCFECFSKHG